MNFSVALIYIGFFALIGAVAYLTGSAWALLALILMPSFTTGSDKKEK